MTDQEIQAAQDRVHELYLRFRGLTFKEIYLDPFFIEDFISLSQVERDLFLFKAISQLRFS